MCSVHHSMAIFNLPSVNTWAPHYRPQWLFLFFYFFSLYFWSIIFILFYILMLMNQIQNKCKMLHNPWMMNNLHETISIEFSMHLIMCLKSSVHCLQEYYRDNTSKIIFTSRDTIKIQLYVQKFNFFGLGLAIYPTS